MSELGEGSEGHPLKGFRKLVFSLKFLSRFDDWWFSKIPPLLTVAFFLILASGMEAGRANFLMAGCLLSIISIAAYGHVVNDIFDIETDARAGKPNTMASLQKPIPLVLSLSLFGAGFFPVWYFQLSMLAAGIIFLNYLWPTLYSVPPVRLKERGLAGVLLDAAGSHITPTLLILIVFAHEYPASSDHTVMPLAIASILWAIVQGLKGILNHQLSDRENDEASGTSTWVRSMDESRIRSFLLFYNLAVELPVNAALIVVAFPFCPIAAIVFLIYLAIETIKNRLGFEFALNQNPQNNRPSVPFANDLFYGSWLPFAGALQLSLSAASWTWLPLLSIAVFFRNYRILWQDTRAVTRAIFQRLSPG